MDEGKSEAPSLDYHPVLTGARKNQDYFRSVLLATSLVQNEYDENLARHGELESILERWHPVLASFTPGQDFDGQKAVYFDEAVIGLRQGHIVRYLKYRIRSGKAEFVDTISVRMIQG